MQVYFECNRTEAYLFWGPALLKYMFLEVGECLDLWYIWLWYCLFFTFYSHSVAFHFKRIIELWVLSYIPLHGFVISCNDNCSLLVIIYEHFRHSFHHFRSSQMHSTLSAIQNSRRYLTSPMFRRNCEKNDQYLKWAPECLLFLSFHLPH